MAQAARERAARDEAKQEENRLKYIGKVKLTSAQMAQAARERAARDEAKQEERRQKESDRIRNLNNALQVREDKKRLDKTQKVEGLVRQLSAAQGAYKNFSLSGFMSSAGPNSSRNALLSQLEISRTLLNKRSGEALTAGLQATSGAFKELSLNVSDAIAELRRFDSQAKKEGQALSSTQEAIYNKHYRRRGEVDRLRAGKEIYQRVGMNGIGSLAKNEMEYVRDYVAFAQKAGKIRQTQISNMDIAPLQKRTRQDNIASEIADLSKAQRIVQSEIRGNVGLLREVGRSVNSFFRYAFVYGGLYKLSSEFSNLIGNTVRFKDALKGIQTISQSTDAQMVRLAQSIKDVASNSSYSMAEIADAAQTLAQAGVDISKIPGALQAVNNFALATGSNPQVATDVLTSAQNIYPNQNYTQLTDQLTGTVNISKLSAEDLKTIFNLAAQTAASSGISSQQLLGASATLSNLGIKSSTIATGLRELILEIFNPDNKAIDFLKRRYTALGENLGEAEIKAVFRGFQRTSNPLQNAFAELRRLGVTGAARDEFRRIYETRAENVAIPLISRPGALSKNIAGVGQIGSAAEGARTRIDSLSSALKVLTNELEMTTEEITGGTLDSLKTVTQKASDILKNFRDNIDERQLKGQSLSSKIAPTLAAGALAATSNTFGPVGKVVAGAAGALAGFSASTAAEGVGGVVAGLTNWIITVFGILSLLGGKKVKEWNAKAARISVDAAKAGSGASGIGAIVAALTSIFGSFESLKKIPGLLKAPLALLKGFKFGIVGAVVTAASGLYELFQVLKELNPKDQVDAIRRKVSTLEGEVQKNTEAFSNWDPKADGSISQQVNKTKELVLKYQETLLGLFGDRADEAEKLLQSLGDVGLESGTDRANEVKAKLEALLKSPLSERQMSGLVSAQNQFAQAQSDLIGKSEMILQRIVQLSSVPKDKLTEEEKSLLATFETYKTSVAFDSVSKSAAGLIDKSNSLLGFISSVFDGQTGALDSALASARGQLGAAEIGGAISSGNGSQIEAQILQLLGTPSAENRKKLDEIRKELQSRQSEGERRSGATVIGRTAGAAEAARLGSILDTRLPEYQRAIDDQVKVEEDKARQAKDQAAREEADKERFAKEEETLRETRLALQMGEVEAERQRIDVEEEIAKAKEAQDAKALTKEGGLLDQKYKFKEKQLQYESDQANLEFRKSASEAGIKDTTDLKVIFGSGNEQIAEKWKQWKDAETKLLEVRRDRAKEELTIRNSIRPLAYSPSNQAEDNAKRIQKLDLELGDTEKENYAEVEKKYNEIKNLTLANLDEEIQFLKSQEGNYKAQDSDKYKRDLANLEEKRRDAEVSIEKKKNTALVNLRKKMQQEEIASLEEERRRLLKQIEIKGNSPDGLRAATLEVTGRAQSTVPSAPAVMGGRLSPNAQTAYQYFVQKGLQPHQSAAFVGNLMAESHSRVDPTTVNKEGAVGIAQWLDPGRKRGLLAKSQPYQLSTQLDYIWEELNTTYRGAKKALLASKDLASATKVVFDKYETPLDNSLPNRQVNAKKVLAAMQGQGAIDPGNSAEIATLNERLKIVQDLLDKKRLENLSSSPTSKEDLRSIVQQIESDAFDNITKSQNALIDGVQSQLDSQDRLLAQTEALGLLQGPSYTATREAAGIPNSPADELGRLKRLEAVYLENSKAYYEAAVELSNKINEANTLLEALTSEKQKLESKAKSGAGLTPEEQAALAKINGEIDGLTNGKKQLESQLRNTSQGYSETLRGLATNRQNQQNYNYSLFGGPSQQVPVLDANGQPITTTIKENGKDVPIQLVETTKALGQLDQVNLKAIAGGLNNLAYSFKNLGRNINDFIVNVIDTTVDHVSRAILGLNKANDAAVNAEYQQSISNAQYDAAIRNEQIRTLQSNANPKAPGYSPEAIRNQRQNIDSAYQASQAANKAQIEAAAAAKQQQESQSGLGGALASLTQEFGVMLMKTAIMTPIEGIINGIAGKADGSETRPFWVKMVGSKADVAAGDATSSGGVIDKAMSGDFTGALEGAFSNVKDSVTGFFDKIGSFFSEGMKSGGWLDTLVSGAGSFFSGIVGGLFADGGYVKGPGSGTSDSIPAWLSNGEYVLTAAEVQKIGVRNLDTWKSAMMKPARFASGGMVGTFDRARGGLSNSGSSLGDSGSSVINIIDQRSMQNSEPVEVKKSKSGEKETIDILVRDAVKKAINDGKLDRTMQSTYGIRRTGAMR